MEDSSIAKAYSEAEVAIKRAEFLFVNDGVADIDGLLFPPVNELRYAGKHLSEVLAGHNSDENLSKARHHCKRALYDALDASVLFLLYRIDILISSYGTSVMKSVVVKYDDIIEGIDKIREAQEYSMERDVDATRARIEGLKEFYTILKKYEAKLDLASYKRRIVLQLIKSGTFVLCFIAILMFLMFKVQQ